MICWSDLTQSMIICGFRVYVGKQGHNNELKLSDNVVMALIWVIIGINCTTCIKTKGQIKTFSCPFKTTTSKKLQCISVCC